MIAPRSWWYISSAFAIARACFTAKPCRHSSTFSALRSLASRAWFGGLDRGGRVVRRPGSPGRRPAKESGDEKAARGVRRIRSGYEREQPVGEEPRREPLPGVHADAVRRVVGPARTTRSSQPASSSRRADPLARVLAPARGCRGSRSASRPAGASAPRPARMRRASSSETLPRTPHSMRTSTGTTSTHAATTPASSVRTSTSRPRAAASRRPASARSGSSSTSTADTGSSRRPAPAACRGRRRHRGTAASPVRHDRPAPRPAPPDHRQPARQLGVRVVVRAVPGVPVAGHSRARPSAVRPTRAAVRR